MAAKKTTPMGYGAPSIPRAPGMSKKNMPNGKMMGTKTCSSCGGSGRKNGKACASCGGTGKK